MGSPLLPPGSPHLHCVVGQETWPWPQGPRDEVCCCTEPCALNPRQALRCHRPKDALAPSAAGGSRRNSQCCRSSPAPSVSPSSRPFSLLRGNVPGLLSPKDSVQWEEGLAEGLRRGKCLLPGLRDTGEQYGKGTEPKLPRLLCRARSPAQRVRAEGERKSHCLQT